MGTKFTKLSKKQKKDKKPPQDRPAHPNKYMSGKQESVALITDHLSDVREKYHIQPKELGHGHYGVVRKCQERRTGEWFAIKSIRKKKVGKLDVLKREIDILKEVSVEGEVGGQGEECSETSGRLWKGGGIRSVRFTRRLRSVPP
ncbi:hypothetical protein TrLO_g10614 [Triparma laevis f. longispina]|uniref:Protein kinase domain-containing protein n=1 Tax=Triparma laevis f. longispina TaxID=1714387 RepID=A0A9W7APC4_9STRA|nr:hypothetical protein TrLO_g10614 [Triparma laevis f. longispina]